MKKILFMKKSPFILPLLFLCLVFPGCNTAAVKQQTADPALEKFTAENEIIRAMDIDGDGSPEYIEKYNQRPGWKPVIFTRVSGQFVKITADKGMGSGPAGAGYGMKGMPAALRSGKGSYLLYAFEISRPCESEALRYAAGGLILVYKFDGKSLAYVKGFVHDEPIKVEDCDKYYSGNHEGFERVKMDRTGAGVVSNAGASEILVCPESSAGIFGLIDGKLEFTQNAFMAAAGQEATLFGSPMHVMGYCRDKDGLIIAYHSFPLAIWSLNKGMLSCGRHDIIGPSNCTLNCAENTVTYYWKRGRDTFFRTGKFSFEDNKFTLEQEGVEK